jgi:hypothetical protein
LTTRAKADFPTIGTPVPHNEVVRRRKAGGAYKARLWKALRQAERRGDTPEIIDAATVAVNWYDNGERLPQMIRHAFGFGHNKTAENPETFWPILIGVWDGFDGTCDEEMFWQTALVNIMSQHKPCSGLDFLTDTSGGFYADLPDMVTVYRGCARKHLDGIAWTTDLDIAGFFAGRRGGAERDPVIATGRIAINDPKFYFTSQERNEFEIVCQPEITRVDPVTEAMFEAFKQRRAQHMQQQAKDIGVPVGALMDHGEAA